MNLISSDLVSTRVLYSSEPYLAHHGIKGQKWGVRRFQNEDGTLTEAGAKRYARDSAKLEKRVNKVQRLSDRLTSSTRRLDSTTRHNIRGARKGSERKQRRIVKATSKVQNAERSYLRNLKRASRLYKRMERMYSSKAMNNLSQQQIDYGKELATRLQTNKSMANISKYYNRGVYGFGS